LKYWPTSHGSNKLVIKAKMHAKTYFKYPRDHVLIGAIIHLSTLEEHNPILDHIIMGQLVINRNN
jgi:hypothetical protein